VPHAQPIIDFIILISHGENLSPDMSFWLAKTFFTVPSSRTRLAIKNRQNYSIVYFIAQISYMRREDKRF
jgi:hypothetical protein